MDAQHPFLTVAGYLVSGTAGALITAAAARLRQRQEDADALSRTELVIRAKFRQDLMQEVDRLWARLDQVNAESERRQTRILELEAQAVTLAGDVAALREEVEALRLDRCVRHPCERRIPPSPTVPDNAAQGRHVAGNSQPPSSDTPCP